MRLHTFGCLKVTAMLIGFSIREEYRRTTIASRVLYTVGYVHITLCCAPMEAVEAEAEAEAGPFGTWLRDESFVDFKSSAYFAQPKFAVFFHCRTRADKSTWSRTSWLN